jgi:hypothetical protein
LYGPDTLSTTSKAKDFHQVKKVIEDGFMPDWAICIESAVKKHQNNSKWI